MLSTDELAKAALRREIRRAVHDLNFLLDEAYQADIPVHTVSFYGDKASVQVKFKHIGEY